jgi:SAM-dependent methyltransferase
VQQILRSLPPGAKVLDLGSGPGSFDAADCPLTIVRADLSAAGSGNFVQCSSDRLPFRDRAFQALILNHSFEHFEHLQETVNEIARMLAPDGLLYIAVPDASTFTDRVYRWLGRGGGHVNLFTDRDAVPRLITAATGLKHVGTRVLCTSLSFLNRRNLRTRPQTKLLLFANGNEAFVRALTYLLRCLDRLFHWRSSVYGWAFYFGEALDPELTTWSNVCVRCGSAEPSALLKPARRPLLPDVYACPKCGTRNFFTADEGFAYLR